MLNCTASGNNTYYYNTQYSENAAHGGYLPSDTVSPFYSFFSFFAKLKTHEFSASNFFMNSTSFSTPSIGIALYIEALMPPTVL